MLAETSTPSRAGIRTSRSSATSWRGSLAGRDPVAITRGSLGRRGRADDAAPAAFEAYLRGRAAMRHLSEVNVARAVEHFNQALTVNRNHGPSLVGLAECYLLQGVTYGKLRQMKDGVSSADLAKVFE